MKKMIQISFEEKQINKLKKESENTGESIACIVRLALRKYFKEDF